MAACQIPLRVQNDNFCILSLREHIPVLLFSFALHARINTHPPTLKREAFEKLKSFADRSFSFIAPSAWNSLRPASLRNLPTLSLSALKPQLKTFLFRNGPFHKPRQTHVGIDYVYFYVHTMRMNGTRELTECLSSKKPTCAA